MRQKKWLKHDPLWNEKIKIIHKYYNSNGKILDIGCGNGYVLSNLKGEKFGLDSDDEALKLCKKRGLKVIKANLEKPLKLKHKFDTIICLDVLEHLINPENVIQSVYKKLNKGGTFIASVPYHGLVKNLAIALFDFDNHYHYTDWHVRFFTEKMFKELLSDFKKIKIIKIGRYYPLYKNMIAVCEK
jgi:2-polyprenyl-3-methyl-5-hydroxy-6-metoxy-1,4-benzoquinol methylase